ncbi:winged helix-turn-helix domain-containing protein [Clostridium minihomine]|uniref:winged helix-turn-helix domain-containing protein n=1 Tax=Clostridium minihomine TaxID=2045012 RepID=UPI000C75EBEF|nr:LysR family transcriptional regulator [Clostridium minihomine]
MARNDNLKEQSRTEVPEPCLSPMLRLTLKKKEKFFGPGVAALLHLIDQKGSIQMACEEMDMSYSKAWKILKHAANELGYPLLNSKAGGAKGGQSTLSPEALDFLASYDAMSKALEAHAEELFEYYFKNNR